MSKYSSTKFQKSIKAPDLDRHVLMKGSNNGKLGFKIKKGRMWEGKRIYSLTLVERETCPTSCHHWDDCYGNNMPFAKRWNTSPNLRKAIEQDISRLVKKHKDGIVVRLHVLGDFYSVGYVNFWRDMLTKYPTLCIFGYTARLSGSIMQNIVFMNAGFSDRCVIRYSKNKEYTEAISNHGSEIYDLRYAATEEFEGKAFQCPEQVRKVDSCADCGLCWAAKSTVRFLSH